MTYREYPEGLDCVWVASDRDGNLGAFVTGGVGPIPFSALDSKSLPLENLEECLHGLPKVSSTKLLLSLPRPDDFIELAERGFFVFDWRDVHRTKQDQSHAYEQIALPDSPITFKDLSDQIAQIATNVVFQKLRFAETSQLNVQIHTDCNFP